MSHLIPVVTSRRLRFAKAWATQEQLDAYLKEHPNADTHIHYVDPEEASRSDDDHRSKPTDAPIENAPKPGHAVLDAIKGDTSLVGDVIRNVQKGGKPTMREVLDALNLAQDVVESGATTEELAEITRVTKYLRRLSDDTEDDDRIRSKQQRVDKGSMPKTVRVDFLKFLDQMRGEPQRPNDVDDIRADFLTSLSDAKMRAVVEDLDREDFERLYAEWFKDRKQPKTGSLRERLIRVAYMDDRLRPHILLLLTSP